MTPYEIRTRIDLAFQQIDTAKERVKELQSLCKHEKAELKGTLNIYKVCSICNKMLEIDGNNVNDWW